MVTRGRLASDVPQTGEAFHELLQHPHARIKHIVSSSTPDTSEYDQAEDEFVLVLRGSATMQVGSETVELTAGDHLVLPARSPHRVLRTDAGTEWLAVYLRS